MQKDDKTLVFASWVIVEPAEDIPGVWVGHWLELDVISQGDSPQGAIDAVAEAAAMTVVDDLQRNADLSERRAPSEFWERLAHVLKHGDQVKIADVSGESKRVLAANVTLFLERHLLGFSADSFSFPTADNFNFNFPTAMAAREPTCAAA